MAMTNGKAAAQSSAASVYEHLLSRGLSRRDFLRLCGAAAVLLELGRLPVPGEPGRSRRALRQAIARALQNKPRRPLIWLSAQDCAGCSEAFSRSREPRTLDLLLDSLSVEYHELLSAATGQALEEHRRQAMERFAGQYLLVVEGSVPVTDQSVACTVGGRAVGDVIGEAASQAAGVLAVGSCATFGGIPAAAPNPTGAVDVRPLVRAAPLVLVPGCPPVPEVLAGTLLHHVVFDTWPERDELGRPMVYYGQSVHANCPRRPFFRRGQFAESFDDSGARAGWCLLHLGCRGPETANACSTRGWGNGLSFPVAGGHPCFGCSEPGFWDRGGIYPGLASDRFRVFLPQVARE